MNVSRTATDGAVRWFWHSGEILFPHDRKEWLFNVIYVCREHTGSQPALFLTCMSYDPKTKEPVEA